MTHVNVVSSYFYYMWNKWNKQECEIVYGNAGLSQHFWSKWCGLAEQNVRGAAERFYAELSDHNRELLVSRAIELYDGKENRNPNNTLVCPNCGSLDVEISIWVNANTEEFVAYGVDDWCRECGEHVFLCKKTCYEDEMQEWWNNLEFIAMERITGLRESDYSPEDGSQAFVDACSKWWGAKSYDEKRELYNKNYD